MSRVPGVLLTLLYPALIYFGSRYFPPPVLALALIPMLWLRGDFLPGRTWLAAGIAVLLALTLLSNDALPLKFYPVMVNVLLLAVFATSLRHPPSAIERIARLREPDLPPAAVAYTWRATAAWCLFFAGNGTLAFVTALSGSDRIWFWYNGVVAYLMIGAMFAGEWLVRRRFRARHG